MIRRTLLPRHLTLWFFCAGLVVILSCVPSTTNTTRPQTLGVFTQTTSIASVGGALVTKTVTGAAADQAGIQENDIIARLGGNVITSVGDLRQKIAATPLGQSVTLVFFRPATGTLSPVTIPIGADASGNLPNVLGFSVAVGNGKSLPVTDLVSGGAADVAGLQKGDLITTVNSSPTTTLNDAWRIFAPLDNTSTVTVHYTRPSAPILNPSTGLDIGYDLDIKAGADAASFIAVPGIFVQNLTPSVASHFNYITTTGAQITNLYRGSPAFNAGLLVGDIIFGLKPLDTGEAEQQVLTGPGLGTLVQTYAGQNVQLRYLRGQLPPIVVTLNLSGVSTDSTQVPAIGMLIEQLYDANNAPSGVRVEQVTTGGVADTAGLSRDDRITQVNNSNVASIADFWVALLGQYDALLPDLTAGTITSINIVLRAVPTSGPPEFLTLAVAAAPT